MLNADKSVRLLQDHDDLGEDAYHEWFLTNDRVKANALGVPNERMAFSTWTVFRCNNSDCGGNGIAQTEKLLQAALETPFNDPTSSI